MTQKELNQAILAELYKAGDKTIQLYMKIKDGIYTAKEINDRKDKLGNELKYVVTDVVPFDIQVEDFKCHADTMNIFMIIERMEKLCRICKTGVYCRLCNNYLND